MPGWWDGISRTSFNNTLWHSSLNESVESQENDPSMSSSSQEGTSRRLGHSNEIIAQIDAILTKLSQINSDALLKAAKEGKLLDFISVELKKSGIDPKKISPNDVVLRLRVVLERFAQGQPGQGPAGSTASSRPRRTGPPAGSGGGGSSPQDLFEQISVVIDENIYEPMWQQVAGPFERKIADSMTDLATFKRIDRLLRTTKVLAFVASPILLLSCLRNFACARPVLGVLYGLLAVDLFKVSSNCYIKTYCALALQKLGADGDPAKIGATIMAWATHTFGVGGKSEDPFKKLQESVMWEVVFNDCFTLRLYRAGRELVNGQGRSR